ncbi:MAG: VanW family protein [Treponema sp.]|nr:VanW family protein [Treponema sp.]
MEKYIPQKKRSKLRVWCGSICYCLLRYFLWARYNSKFAKNSQKKIDLDSLKKQFPFVAFYASSPLYRNLSEADKEMQNGKVSNLLIAYKKVSGIILKPGQIFSYWKLIGQTSGIKGYKKGMMLVNGKPVPKTGGGLCALSNLIYWLTLHSNLTVIERWRHSYDVFPDSNRTRPFGSGATCVYNYRDLMILNNTNQPYVLLIWIEQNKLCGEWRTKYPVEDKYEVFQKDHWITCEVGNVYVRHNTIYRKHFINDDYVGEEQVAENHAKMMYEPLLPEQQN